MIYILSGPIRTGKTTALKNWALERSDVDGLISPDDEESTRYFYEIKSRLSFHFEASSPASQPTIAIGRFHFLKAAFDRANRYLMQSAASQNSTFLIVDEVGKLELKGTGLHRAVVDLISPFEAASDRHLILVIRDTLLEEAINHYQISDYQVISKDQLTEIQS